MHGTNKKNKTVNLALFDFDGTLCTKDSFTGFMFYALSKKHIAQKGIKILPWIQAYFFKLYPPNAMRIKLFNAMFKGTSAQDLQQLGKAYANTLREHFNEQLFEQLLQHQAYGDKVVLVSASINLYLEPLCKLLGIDLICTQVEIKNNHITGSYETPDCSSEQKKVRIQQTYTLSDYAHIYAYGNSHEDLAMLSLADHPYMVGKGHALPKIEVLRKRA